MKFLLLTVSILFCAQTGLANFAQRKLDPSHFTGTATINGQSCLIDIIVLHDALLDTIGFSREITCPGKLMNSLERSFSYKGYAVLGAHGAYLGGWGSGLSEHNEYIYPFDYLEVTDEVGVTFDFQQAGVGGTPHTYVDDNDLFDYVERGSDAGEVIAQVHFDESFMLLNSTKDIQTFNMTCTGGVKSYGSSPSRKDCVSAEVVFDVNNEIFFDGLCSTDMEVNPTDITYDASGVLSLEEKWEFFDDEDGFASRADITCSSN